MKEKIVSYIEQGVFSVRWALIPVYIGLYAALLLYITHFVHEVISLFHSFNANYEIQNVLMLTILELIDMTMILQLIVMTIQGSYSIFVKEFSYEKLHDRPRWLGNNLSSSEQKVKLGMSIIGIVMVHLLHDFIESGHLQYDDLIKKVIILVSVVGATLSFCVFNWFMHPPHAPAHKDEH